MQYRETYAIVDLEKIKYNLDVLYKKTQKPMMAIIKANAYGHGYQQVAHAIKDNPHISMFGVATIKEAIDLRKQGIKQDILVLGAIPLEDIQLAIDYHISLTLFSLEYAKEIEDHYRGTTPVQVHIKLDTGMNRIGMKSEEEFNSFMESYNPHLFQVDGVFTHFATADDESQDDTFTKQYEQFRLMIDSYTFKYVHCQNSAGMMYHEDKVCNLSRVGIAMYGVDPAGQECEELKQAMSLYTKVAMVKRIKAGEKIGYGHTYQASQDEYIATVPIGYADGFIRANQGRHVFIRGSYYPIVGRVCMDQMMIRVDETIKTHDLVEIFGENISLATMARELNTIPYEITCLLSERVERFYK